MSTTRADLDEGPGRRPGLPIDIVSPAGHCAVALQSASMIIAGADLGKGPGRRRGTAIRIAPPAGQCAVAFQPAGMVPPPALNLNVSSAYRQGLPVKIVSPADQCPVALQPAGMVTAGADLGRSRPAAWTARKYSFPSRPVCRCFSDRNYGDQPALTCARPNDAPAGGVDCPYRLPPQQTSVPLLLRPQLCK